MTRNEGRRLVGWDVASGAAASKAPTTGPPASRARATGATILLSFSRGVGTRFIASHVGPGGASPGISGDVTGSSRRIWLCQSLDSSGGLVPVSSAVTVIQGLSWGKVEDESSVGR